MNNLFTLYTTTKPPESHIVNGEQLAVQNLIRILKNTLSMRAKCLLTSVHSPVFEYFDKKRPNYRILKGGQTGLFPVYKQNALWGLIQVQSFELIDRARAQRVMKAINELLLPHLNGNDKFKPKSCEGLNVFLNCKVPDDRIKFALEILDQTTKSCMLYWEALTPTPTRVSELYDIPDTLIFIKEVLSLTQEQRKLISLYMNLPDELRGAQLVISSSYSFSEVKKFLHDDPLFLDTLKRYRFDITQSFQETSKEDFVRKLSHTLLNTTSYGHLY